MSRSRCHRVCGRPTRPQRYHRHVARDMSGPRSRHYKGTDVWWRRWDVVERVQYAYRVIAEIEVTSECRASGIGRQWHCWY
jgi:hypothetical protein